jgi:methyl-accepting chemotaxis protein
MTLAPKGKFRPTLKLKLGTKALICAALVIAVNTALVVGAAYWSLTSEFADRARRDIETNSRTLALAFAEAFKDAKVTLKDGTVSRIEMPQMPELNDHAIVDRAVSYVGGSSCGVPPMSKRRMASAPWGPSLRPTTRRRR